MITIQKHEVVQLASSNSKHNFKRWILDLQVHDAVVIAWSIVLYILFIINKQKSITTVIVFSITKSNIIWIRRYDFVSLYDGMRVDDVRTNIRINEVREKNSSVGHFWIDCSLYGVRSVVTDRKLNLFIYFCWLIGLWD